MAPAVERTRGTAAAWALTAATALGGYLWVVAPAGREIDDVRVRVRALEDTANRDEDLVRRTAAAPAAHLPERLPPLLLARRTVSDRALATLRDLARLSLTHRIAILSFTPSTSAAGARSGRLDVTLTLRGRYDDVLRAVASLSLGSVLFEVRGLTLTPTANQDGWQGVDATVDGALFASATDAVNSGKENPHMVAFPRSELRIARNPFEGVPAPPQTQTLPALPELATLPPNVGAGIPTLRAVIEGRPPRALVEVGDRPTIVRVGSHLGLATVTSISAGAVRLDDGRTLHLTDAKP